MKRKNSSKDKPVRAPDNPRIKRHHANNEFAALKKGAGLTDASAGEMIGVSPITVRSWLRGHGEANYRRTPRIAVITLRYALNG